MVSRIFFDQDQPAGQAAAWAAVEIRMRRVRHRAPVLLSSASAMALHSPGLYSHSSFVAHTHFPSDHTCPHGSW